MDSDEVRVGLQRIVGPLHATLGDRADCGTLTASQHALLVSQRWRARDLTVIDGNVSQIGGREAWGNAAESDLVGRFHDLADIGVL